MYTCSSSMAKSLTIFSCFTFWRTSNSRIWTSWGRMWESWLNVLTATDSPLCLFTPYKKVHIKLPELKCFSHGLFKLFGISKKSCFHRFLFLENWPEILLRWLPCLRRWLCTTRSWPILVRTTSFRQACSRSPHQWLIWKTKTTNAYLIIRKVAINWVRYCILLIVLETYRKTFVAHEFSRNVTTDIWLHIVK